MSILESLMDTSQDGVDVSKKYVEASYKYGKLKTFHILSYSLSRITKLFLIGSILSIGFVFTSVAGAIALGEYLENPALGYLIIGLAFFLLSFIVFLIRKSFDKLIIKRMSKQFFDSKK